MVKYSATKYSDETASYRDHCACYVTYNRDRKRWNGFGHFEESMELSYNIAPAYRPIPKAIIGLTHDVRLSQFRLKSLVYFNDRYSERSYLIGDYLILFDSHLAERKQQKFLTRRGLITLYRRAVRCLSLRK